MYVPKTKSTKHKRYSFMLFFNMNASLLGVCWYFKIDTWISSRQRSLAPFPIDTLAIILHHRSMFPLPSPRFSNQLDKSDRIKLKWDEMMSIDTHTHTRYKPAFMFNKMVTAPKEFRTGKEDETRRFHIILFHFFCIKAQRNFPLIKMQLIQLIGTKHWTMEKMVGVWWSGDDRAIGW